MEKDIVPGLLEAINKDFDNAINDNEKLKVLQELIKNGGGDYTDLTNISQLIGEDLSKSLLNNITGEALPDGKMYFNIGDRVLTPTLAKDYEILASLCADVQTNLNKNVGLGIKGIKPTLNQSKVKGFVDKMTTGKFEDLKWMLGEPIVNFSQSVIDDGVMENAEFQAKSGIETTVERIAVGKCCEWCAKLEGKYTYPDVPKEVFARHRSCRCLVTYKPGNGKAQNVHSKKWVEPGEYEQIKKRMAVGKSAEQK